MGNKKKFYLVYGKRIFDFVISVFAVFLLLPILGIISLTVWIAFGQPVLFRQIRPGMGGKLFTIYKFRTMTNVYDYEGKLLPPDQRLTKTGRFLRASSLDELPELWNVIKGDMSLVGPRPLKREYLTLYTPEQSRRHDVIPGITGWAQINGRNTLSWEDRFDLDLWYVENRSLILDLKIILLTIKSVLFLANITPENHEIMHKFTGTKKNE